MLNQHRLNGRLRGGLLTSPYPDGALVGTVREA